MAARSGKSRGRPAQRAAASSPTPPAATPAAPPTAAPKEEPSDIERVRIAKTGRATPAAGERGQVRSQFWFQLRQALGTPNPEKLDIDTLRKMENDPQVRAGIAMRELAILAKPPTFNFTPKNAKDQNEVLLGKRMVSFLEYVWERIQPNPTTVLRNVLSARRFGFSVIEKVWASSLAPGPDNTKVPVLRRLDHPEFAGFVWIEKMKMLPPESIAQNGIAEDEYGNVLAVYQNCFWTKRPAGMEGMGGAVPAAPDINSLRRITFAGDDLKRLIIYPANFEGGNWYGTSDHKSAYTSWYSKQTAIAARNMLLERMGTVIAAYNNPQGEEALRDALDAGLGPGGIVTIPGGSTDAVKLLEGWTDAVGGYQAAIEYDDNQILRAYLVPSLTAGGGAEATGSFARAESNLDSFLLMVRFIQGELEEIMEKHFIQPLIRANFGDVQAFPSFDFPEMQEKDREALARLWQQAITSGYVDPSVDAWWLRRELGVPEDAPGFVFRQPGLGAPQLPAPGAPAARPGALPSPFGQPARPQIPVPPSTGARPAEGSSSPAAARAALPDEYEPTEYEALESGAAHMLVLNTLSNSAASLLNSATLGLMQDALANLPTGTTEEELAKLTISPEAFRDALDEVSEEALERAFEDAAQKFELLGAPDAAKKIREALTRA